MDAAAVGLLQCVRDLYDILAPPCEERTSVMEKTQIAALLDELSAFARRFVSLSQAQADICALWIIHTHAIAAIDFTPYLHITSPMPRSGKATLLELLRLLVANPWFTARVTAAVLVRKTHTVHPTLLLDESDAAFRANRGTLKHCRQS